MHCCTCSRVCHHTSPPSFCEKHGGSFNQPYPNQPVPSVPFPGPYVPPLVPQGPFTVVLTDADIERIARKVVELLRGELDNGAKEA